MVGKARFVRPTVNVYRDDIRFLRLPDELVARRLAYPPQEKVLNVVIDADTGNEIDDQYAVIQTYLARERFKVHAVTTATFCGGRGSDVKDPATGQVRAHAEAVATAEVLGFSRAEAEKWVFMGTEGYLPDRSTPLDNPASREIIRLAHEMKEKGEVLYILSIGVKTNVASAILLDPTIVDNCVMVWAGCDPFYWEVFSFYSEFNVRQDVAAAQVVLDSGIPIILIPGITVSENLQSTPIDMDYRIAHLGKIGAQLARMFHDWFDPQGKTGKAFWDFSAAGFYLTPAAFAIEECVQPTLNDDRRWNFSDTGRQKCLNVRHIVRDPIFYTFYELLERFHIEHPEL